MHKPHSDTRYTQEEIEVQIAQYCLTLANEHGTVMVANALRNVADDYDPTKPTTYPSER